jgi:hypothetical protein
MSQALSKQNSATLLTSVDLLDVGLELEGMGVAERDVDDAVMREGGDAVERGSLLSSSEPSSGNENAGVLARELPSCPELASSIPKSLVQSVVR